MVLVRGECPPLESALVLRCPGHTGRGLPVEVLTAGGVGDSCQKSPRSSRRRSREVTALSGPLWLFGEG